MKTIFDQTARDELMTRINTLNENSKAQWGKMNICQMLKHCTLWEEWIAGKTTYKRPLIGILFGKMALKSFLKQEKMVRNAPTIPEFRINRLGENEDITAEKAKWIALLEGYTNFSNPGFIHSFFGKMTKEQIGLMSYKHNDHHLRQFNS